MYVDKIKKENTCVDCCGDGWGWWDCCGDDSGWAGCGEGSVDCGECCCGVEAVECGVGVDGAGGTGLLGGIWDDWEDGWDAWGCCWGCWGDWEGWFAFKGCWSIDCCCCCDDGDGCCGGGGCCCCGCIGGHGNLWSPGYGEPPDCMFGFWPIGPYGEPICNKIEFD